MGFGSSKMDDGGLRNSSGFSGTAFPSSLAWALGIPSDELFASQYQKQNLTQSCVRLQRSCEFSAKILAFFECKLMT
jgi:hypothetical protein